ncbi:hypothetical protein L195_g014334 [Trifolium pratense]|uniref:Uncharacterized protein n=1 Tax=Trifolium pratense TaxID=57577 RepID=A0A2K3PQM4_TRIPR|nr:hypothetical protein L195_g014334 [Trifolium pratense]
MEISERFSPIFQALASGTDNKATTIDMIVAVMERFGGDETKKCWNNTLPTTFEVRRRETDTLADWLRVEGSSARQHQRSNNETYHKWCKPLPGTLKCNIDAACYVNSNQFSISACIGDAGGGFLKEFVQTFEGQPEIREAKTMVMTDDGNTQMAASATIPCTTIPN